MLPSIIHTSGYIHLVTARGISHDDYRVNDSIRHMNYGFSGSFQLRAQVDHLLWQKF
jgi:hypothetical protein